MPISENTNNEAGCNMKQSWIVKLFNSIKLFINKRGKYVIYNYNCYTVKCQLLKLFWFPFSQCIYIIQLPCPAFSSACSSECKYNLFANKLIFIVPKWPQAVVCICHFRVPSVQTQYQKLYLRYTEDRYQNTKYIGKRPDILHPRRFHIHEY